LQPDPDKIFFRQTLIEKFSSDLASKIFIATTIAVENLIQIDRDPVSILKLDPDFAEKSYSITIGFDAFGGFAPAAWASPTLR